MKPEDSYQPGETAIYWEGGGSVKIQIIKNNSDSKKIAYELRLLEIREKSDSFKKIKIGDIFTFWKDRKVQNHPLMGRLTDLSEPVQ